MIFIIEWPQYECGTVILHDPDINFQGKKIEMLISRKWWNRAQKCMSITFINVIILNVKYSPNCTIMNVVLITQWPWPLYYRTKMFLLSIGYWIAQRKQMSEVDFPPLARPTLELPLLSNFLPAQLVIHIMSWFKCCFYVCSEIFYIYIKSRSIELKLKKVSWKFALSITM